MTNLNTIQKCRSSSYEAGRYNPLAKAKLQCKWGNIQITGLTRVLSMSWSCRGARWSAFLCHLAFLLPGHSTVRTWKWLATCRLTCAIWTWKLTYFRFTNPATLAKPARGSVSMCSFEHMLWQRYLVQDGIGTAICQGPDSSLPHFCITWQKLKNFVSKTMQFAARTLHTHMKNSWTAGLVFITEGNKSACGRSILCLKQDRPPLWDASISQSHVRIHMWDFIRLQ